MKQNKRTRYAMGIHCIQELLTHRINRVVKIYTTKQASQREFLRKFKVPIEIKGKDELTRMVNSESHQSIVAEVLNTNPLHLADLVQNLQVAKNSTLLLLDSINDPHNLGAILRAAECFKVDAVIWSKNRGVDITPIVTKTSSGASELVPCIKVSNLSECVSFLKKEGFVIVAADANPESQNLFTFKFPEKMVLIMGSEGKGIQPLILKRSDVSLYIPMFGKIDSLNVSQATAVILSYFMNLSR